MSTETDPRVADARAGHWAYRLLPRRALPFAQLARLDRPIGWWLLLWPCWWSAALAAIDLGNALPNPWHLALFLIGAVAMRGAGCTWNDIVDRDIDAKVARTRSRPIPSGRVTTRQAAAFLGLQALVGLLVLLQFNGFAIGLGFASLAVVAIYPFTKRLTRFPQVVLGLAFGWGALMGYAAAAGRLDWPAVLLYAGTIAWIVGYDTIYAHQDREDDAMVGLGSTALVFAAWTKPWLAICYGIAVLLWLGALVAVGAGALAYVGLAATGAQLTWQVVATDVDDPAQCLRVFKSNTVAGWIMFGGLVADALVAAA